MTLHQDEIGNNPERISKLQYYEDQYNRNGLEFLLAIHKIGKFERKNSGVAVNVLFNSKKEIYTARKSELYGKRSKQANLLMILEGGNTHHKAIKNLSGMLKSLNTTHKGACHFCMNCLNGFHTASARENTMSTAAVIVTSRSRCLLRKKNSQIFTMGCISLRLHLCYMQTLKTF